MEVSPEQVEQAVIQFYENPVGKTEINTWLTEVQHSSHAWKFAWPLLESQKREEVRFFAGNTIYIKVSRYWHEVPKEEYESLKIRILQLIVQYSNSRSVLTRLLKALASYVIHTIEVQWRTALEDIINMFHPERVSGVDPSAALELLFNILVIIPDELDSCQDTMGIRTVNKNIIKNILKDNSQGVMSLIQQVMQSNQISNVTKEVVLKTLNTWLRLSVPLIETKELLVSLIPYSNYGLLCEPVIECIKTAVTDVSTYNVPDTVMDFITQILGLKPVLDEALHCDDETTSAMIYSLLTSIVESHSRLLLQSALDESHRQAVIQVVSLLVDCSATPGQYPTQETLSNIPFAVWYTVQDDILSFEGEQQAELLRLFKPVYLKLVDTFIQKSLLPHDSSLNAEEKELFRCYRQDICDTYMYAYHILKGDMLSRLEAHLKDGVAKIQADPNDWNYLEAVLHAYSSVAETVAESDNVYVPRFIQSIPQIPFSDNVQLISVALTTLGAYADWLNFHHDHLHHVIPLMVAGLVNNKLVGAASQALRDLTLECPLTIAPFCQPILQSCQKALEQCPRIDSAETERIVTIISRVLSVGMDQRAVMVYLNTILTPYITRITHLKNTMDSYPSESQKQELVSLIKLISCLARHLNLNNSTFEDEDDEPDSSRVILKINPLEPQPLLLVLQPLMPILSEISTKFATEQDIIEAICKLLKNSICTLMEDCLSILSSILEIIPSMYEKSLNSAVFDLVKQMIISTTLSRASNDLWGHTDTIQGCLSLLVSAVRKTPGLMAQQQIPQLIVFAIEALKLPEESTVKSAGLFLSAILSFSRDPLGSAFQPIISHSMELFLRTLLYCICHSTRHCYYTFSDLFTLLSKLYGNDLFRAFKVVQTEDNFPSPKITALHKEEFARKILRHRCSRRKVLEAITDLALISRGIAGTEYGAQSRE